MAGLNIIGLAAGAIKEGINAARSKSAADKAAADPSAVADQLRAAQSAAQAAPDAPAPAQAPQAPAGSAPAASAQGKAAPAGTAAASQVSAPAPADMNRLRPAAPGTIGPDQSKWPGAFTNAKSETYQTAKFEGLDSEGMARVRLQAGSGPSMIVDIGARGMSQSERSTLVSELSTANQRSPILLKSQVVGGKPVFVPCIVESGNAQSINVREIKTALGQVESRVFMDPKIFARSLESIDKELSNLKLDRVPAKPAVGQQATGSAGSWLDQSVNASINSALDGLKARGIPYAMGGKGDLSSANALDCSGFASSLMRKVGQNLDASTGQRVSQTPSGSAADLVAGVRQNGGAMAVQDLLRNPRPGCLIGLNTGAPHGAGRPLGIDHVGVTVLRDGKPCVAEFTPGKDGKGGLHVTPLNEWVNRYERKGAGIYVAGGPEAMCNRQALAAATQPEPQKAQAPAPAPAQVADAGPMAAGR